MASSGMLRRVALVRADVSEERSASFIKVTRLGELGTTLAVTSNRRTLRCSSETSVLIRATRRNIPEDTILEPPHPCDVPKNLYYIYNYVKLFSKLLNINSSTALCWTLVAFSDYYSHTQSAGPLGRGISPSQDRHLHAG
jgi:hypothetical protein